MTKPEIPELKHARIIPELLRHAGDGLVVSAWWLSIPVYIFLMLIVKASHRTHSQPLGLLHDLIRGQHLTFVLLFLVVPLLIAIGNGVILRKIWYLSGSPDLAGLIRIGWRNVLVMLLCTLIVFIYL